MAVFLLNLAEKQEVPDLKKIAGSLRLLKEGWTGKGAT